MERVINFLNNLSDNNNRDWFERNKGYYKESVEIFNSFVIKLIDGIAQFDDEIKNIGIKDCTYRIYRDVRFSKDKSPYKTHMGAFISKGGKKGSHSGYYFHIEADNANYIGSSILSTGIYMPESHILKSIREEIMLNGDEMVNAIEFATGFALDTESSLSRVPSGFPANDNYSQLYKLKNYFLFKKIDKEFLLGDHLLERVVNEYKKTQWFNNLLNKAVDYSLEMKREWQNRQL